MSQIHEGESGIIQAAFIEAYLDHRFEYDGDIADYANKTFSRACLQNNLPLAKWLLVMCSDLVDIHVDEDWPFVCACYRGHLTMAQWLWYLDGNVDVHCFGNAPFRYACEKGHMHVLQWLLALDDQMVLHIRNLAGPFFNASFGGHLAIAQWLFDLGAHVDKSLALSLACVNNQLHMAQWLWSLDGPVTDTTKIFVDACDRGFMEIAQYLLKVCGASIDIHAEDDRPFMTACENGHLDLARWLCGLEVWDYPFPVAGLVTLQVLSQSRAAWMSAVARCIIAR